jgi:3-oxoacyl-[acyl-carrier-protein] synthase III
MKTFDVGLVNPIPPREIRAPDAECAVELYLAAVRKALSKDVIEAVEIDVES